MRNLAMLDPMKVHPKIKARGSRKKRKPEIPVAKKHKSGDGKGASSVKQPAIKVLSETACDKGIQSLSLTGKFKLMYSTDKEFSDCQETTPPQTPRTRAPETSHPTETRPPKSTEATPRCDHVGQEHPRKHVSDQNLDYCH